MTDSKNNKHAVWLLAGLNLEAEQCVFYLHFYADIHLVITESNCGF
jgi:hypothetical protein